MTAICQVKVLIRTAVIDANTDSKISGRYENEALVIRIDSRRGVAEVLMDTAVLLRVIAEMGYRWGESGCWVCYSVWRCRNRPCNVK